MSSSNVLNPMTLIAAAACAGTQGQAEAFANAPSPEEAMIAPGADGASYIDGENPQGELGKVERGVAYIARGGGDDHQVDFSITNRSDSKRGVAMFNMGSVPFPADGKLTIDDLLLHRVTEAQERSFEDRHKPIILKPFIRSKEITELALTNERVTPHNAEELETILGAMLLEQNMYVEGAVDRLTLLRSVRNSSDKRESFAIDGLRSLLPDFDNIRTVILNSGSVAVIFNHLFHLDRVKDDLVEAGYKVSENMDTSGRRKLSVVAPDGGKFCINRTSVRFSTDTEVSKFDANFTRFVEFIAAVQFKGTWATDSENIFLNRELKPTVELILGDNYPRDWLGEQIATLQQGMEEGFDFDGSDQFAETKTSRIQRQKGVGNKESRSYLWLSSGEFSRIEFITVRTGERPVATIKFDCEIDAKALGAHLAEMEGEKLFLTSEKEKRSRRQAFVNKGKAAGLEIRQFNAEVRQSNVLNEDGKQALSFQNDGGKSVVFIPLADDTIGAAANVIDAIYDEMFFYTTTGRNREIGSSGLKQEEYEIVTALRTLTRLYRFFLEVKDQKKYYEMFINSGKALEMPTPESWMTARMQEAGEGAPFHEMVLGVLNALDERVDPANFAELVTNEETQSLAHEHYGTLKSLKGKFEAMRMIYASSVA